MTGFAARLAPRGLRRLGKYRIAAATSLRSRLVYRGNLLGGLFTYGLFIFVFSRIWAAAYATKGTIAGYDYAMSVWYFIIAEVCTFGFGRFFWTLAEDVKSGQVVYLLTRPYSFVGYHWAQAMGQSLLDAGALLVEGLAAGLILAGLPPSPSLGRAGLTLLSILAAGSILFFLQMAIAMTAFWVEENSAFFWIFQKFALVIGTLLPIEFLPDGARRIALLTPFPSMSWAPARIMVAATPGEALGIIGAQLGWLAFAIAVCALVFRAGRTRLTVQGG
jgi:ABC-2 type transport system permease protein